MTKDEINLNKRYVLLQVDNFNRFSHPDKIIEVSYDKSVLQRKADEINNRNSDVYWVVVDEDYKFNFDSLYDISTEVPTFENFCKYTGLNELSLDKARKVYNLRYKTKKYYHLSDIKEKCNNNEMEINKYCVDIFVDLLLEGKLKEVHWVRRYITEDMYEGIDLKKEMLNKLEISYKKKKRSNWWYPLVNYLIFRQLLHEHSFKKNEGNNIDMLNLIMFICFRENEIIKVVR